MSPATREQLRRIPLFSALDDDGLKTVAALATEFEATTGHVLIERNQPGTGLFIIEEGTVRVDLPDEGHIELGPGMFFGEVSVLAEVPRTARVSVTSPLRGLAIRRSDLLALLEGNASIATAMLHELAHRFADTNKHLA